MYSQGSKYQWNFTGRGERIVVGPCNGVILIVTNGARIEKSGFGYFDGCTIELGRLLSIVRQMFLTHAIQIRAFRYGASSNFSRLL